MQHEPAGGREPVQSPPIPMHLSGRPDVPQAVVLDRHLQLRPRQVYSRDEAVRVIDDVLRLWMGEPGEYESHPKPALLWRASSTIGKRQNTLESTPTAIARASIEALLQVGGRDQTRAENTVHENNGLDEIQPL